MKLEMLLIFLLIISDDMVKSQFADKEIFPRLPNIFDKVESQLCQRESELFVKNLDNFTLWAEEIWDASAKSSSGLLSGSRFQLGNMEECMKLQAPYNTQYCLIPIEINVPPLKQLRNRDPFGIDFPPNEQVLPKLQKTEDISQVSRHILYMAMCVPESCSRQELESFYNKYMATLDHPLQQYNVTYSVNIPPQLCQSKTDVYPVYRTSDIIFCCLVATIFLLVVISTWYEYMKCDAVSDKKPKPNAKINLLLAFSAIKNYRELAKPEEDGPLYHLYGVRVLAIFVIVLCHRVGTFLSGPIINFDYIEHAYRETSTWIMYRGDMLVDTFFVLSGTLGSYGLLVQFDKKIINPAFIIFLRYIRLTPIYAFVIFYYATMLLHAGSGPLWKLMIAQESQDCRDNWWTSLLYISTYVNDDHICMGHSWYLPCDFHYFIICVVTAFLIHRNKKLGLACLIILLILSLVSPFVMVIIDKQPAFLHFYPDFLTNPKMNSTFRKIYSKSHMRATPYVVGMIVGYIYYRFKGSEKKLSKRVSHSITAISILFICTTIVGGFPFYNRYRTYNAIEAGAYASLHRLLWGMGTAGLLFTASYGHASITRRVLSWYPFVPLSKLVYGVYLVHMNFQIRYVAMSKQPNYYNYPNVLWMAFGDVVTAFIVAFFLYLGIEGPTKKIFKQLIYPPRPPTKNITITNNNNTSTSDANNSSTTEADSRL